MRFFAWLLGKREETVPTALAEKRASAPLGTDRLAAAPGTEKRDLPSSEAENLRRWKESGQARAWVEGRQGRWGHADWLALLDELKRSPYWPMQPDAVGMTLEELKRERLRRN